MNLRTVLGIAQFGRLVSACRSAQHDFRPSSPISPALIVITAAIALVPIFAHSTGQYYSIDITSILIGCSALISWIVMRRIGISFLRRESLYQDLKLTHYAFAFGCIPGVLVLILFGFDNIQPDDLLVDQDTGILQASIFARVVFILMVAMWAATTEELIFRALLIGVVRRLKLFGTQKKNDLFAVAFSSAIFAISHAMTWGPAMGIALFGIGLGLGFAFIATREHIFPLIVYHCLFDILSLTAIFIRS